LRDQSDNLKRVSAEIIRRWRTGAEEYILSCGVKGLPHHASTRAIYLTVALWWSVNRTLNANRSVRRIRNQNYEAHPCDHPAIEA
jgi:hypothetical protein